MILFIAIFLSFFYVRAETISTAEGSIKHIGKSTSYSPPFILLSSLQRFYVTQEVYDALTNSKPFNKHLYFELKNNKIVSFSESPPSNYVYCFPSIMNVRKYDFDRYDVLYVTWYFNFSPFVEIKSITKNVSIYYTSSNSVSIIIPKDQRGRIELVAIYENKNINQQKKYIIEI
ncbi:MAG: hypothetical protein ABDH21_03425 [bacterium]